MSERYEVVSSERIYDGAIISVRKDLVRMSDGSVAPREVVEHPGAVGVLALDDDDRVLLVNQYRHPLGRRLDELPAGLLDKDGEPAIEAAKRELAEEAGVIARDWSVLCDLNPTPGMSDEAIRIYLARGISDITEPDFAAEHEELTLTVERVPLEAALARVARGELTNASAVAGLFAAAWSRANGWSGLRPADSPWPDRPGDAA